MILPREFYLRPVQIVARDMLGKRLIHLIGNQRVGGIIVEAEAYDGEQDLACHARVGKTERNKVMYFQGGHAYVYFTYGMHWMLNCVTGETGYPSAVLIRSIVPYEGLDFIKISDRMSPKKYGATAPQNSPKRWRSQANSMAATCAIPRELSLLKTAWKFPKVMSRSLPE